MMRRVAGLLLFVLLACGEDPDYRTVEPYCAEPDEDRQTWVLDCVEYGNPHSDEEPENLVHACVGASVVLFCPLVELCGTLIARRPCTSREGQ